MSDRIRGAGAVLLAAVLILVVPGVAAAAPTQAGVGCPDAAAPVRVPLWSPSSPPPDLSTVAFCAAPDRSFTVVSNSSDDLWLVLPPVGLAAEQRGGVPALVQAFRSVRGPTPGRFWLEPGTSVLVRAAPELVTIQVDHENQGRWTAFTLLELTASAGQEHLPELIKKPKWRAATSSCLEAGKRMITTVAAERYDTATLLDYMGLTTKSGQCAGELEIAETERQSLALRRTGHPVSDLRPSRFAQFAIEVTPKLDRLLQRVGAVVHHI